MFQGSLQPEMRDGWMKQIWIIDDDLSIENVFISLQFS